MDLLAYQIPSSRASIFCFLLFLAASLVLPGSTLADEPSGDVAKPDFENEVLPLLKEHCFDCHSHESGDASGGLMLDSLASMRRGGTRGAAVVEGDLKKSLLYRAAEYSDSDLQMPPDGQLPDESVELLRRWVATGAHVPNSFRGSDSTTTPETSLDALIENHWAYQLPNHWNANTSDRSASTTVDAILNEGLKEAELKMSRRADRKTLIHRAHFDLLGLPPTFEEVARFVKDPRDDRLVFQELINELMASPHFGERWARYWMDVGRYADNKGYVFREDREYAGAYQYRDWLIRAWNGDLPYDQFVAQQLAADLLAAEGEHDSLPALGFLTLGRRFLNNKFDIIDDRIDVVSRGLLGMTLTCARCHDHKYDPLTQADYYSLAGVFLNTDEPGDAPWPHRLVDAEKNRQAFILLRGSPGSIGPKVPRKFVSFLAPGSEPFASGSGRAELAKQIVSASNPLAARVIANRIWLHLSGSSIVESPSDFGVRCPEPKQIALLDHFATYLMDHQWSLKALIREIVLSDFYAQSSFPSAEHLAKDPTNALYGHMNRRRADFETMRDTLLARAGNLNEQIFGKSEKIHEAPFSVRRTVYAYIDRQNLPSIFRTFDMASPDTHNPKRAETSVPQQGLFMMNSDFVLSQAELLAETQPSGDSSEVALHAQVDQLFRQVLARDAMPNERAWFVEFLKQQQAQIDQEQQARAREDPWSCGYASFDPTQEQLGPFHVLPEFHRGSWQGGAKLPDAQLGWCVLHAAGGHPGNDLQHAVVRRWTAARAGDIDIAGRIVHRQEEGDGVRVTILHNGKSLGRWLVRNGESDTVVGHCKIEPGDVIDFVTDCITSPNHDSFEWKVEVAYAAGQPRQFRSEKQLPKPRPELLTPLGQAAQVLLLSNELTFVD